MSTPVSIYDSKIELKYFDVNIRANLIRGVLEYKKIKYNDNRYGIFRYMCCLKPCYKLEWGMLPELKIDGKTYFQSNAIAMYLAKRAGGLYGKTDEDEFKINSLVFSAEDYVGKCYVNLGFPRLCKSDSTINKKLKECQELVVKFFNEYEKQYIENGEGKYYLGEEFTLADIYLSCITQSLCMAQYKGKSCLEETIQDACPKLMVTIKNVKMNEMKSYFDNVFNKDPWFIKA